MWRPRPAGSQHASRSTSTRCRGEGPLGRPARGASSTTSTPKESGIEVEVVKRSDQAKGFVVQPKRWIVERTFGWNNREMRLSKDYERTEESSEAFLYISMTRLMLRRLA
ncbi:transposase [Archangium sp.]|uniref:transposase n=1 Tax=Archangium sp. TaxID=1872627 RepID=UPI0038D49A47